jgi:formate/nitrite transporter FocA (FNT family)
MHTLIEFGKWLGIVMAGFVFAGALIVGTLSWLLNHPD